ncbi:CinY protein [Streptomyces sp. NPDC001339]|uniref:CinY protein n=1 Tax=Streptomyces sp. NPDC001339 TaxID=3364563 RepID=UPI0036D06155
MTASLLVPMEKPAQAFGTINRFGQQSEHERITRAALACPAGAPSDGTCFEPRSLDQLAGKSGTFGAVGAPDTDEILSPAAHCDNADYLALSGYPHSREQANAALASCVRKLQTRFAEGVSTVDPVFGSDGAVIEKETTLSTNCTFTLGISGRAKCNALEGFGRALHGAQDFYSHSNWTDRTDTARAVGTDNPPGLNLKAPAPVLNLISTTPLHPSAIPPDLSTGCFSLLPGCRKRIRHHVLNKDNGLIHPMTGAATSPKTARGRTVGNFQRAVEGAVTETRRQWRDFRAALTDRYGTDRGRRAACVLTHDAPVRDCR